MTSSFPLYYETFGESHQDCIILITGIGAQLIHWPKMLIEELVNQGFYVVLFDNRDAGLSKSYDELGSPSLFSLLCAKIRNRPIKNYYSLEDMAADVLMLMDHISQDKAHIMGISMGGMIAQEVALRYCNRVSSLTLVGTTSGDPHIPSAAPALKRLFSISSFYKKEDLKSYVENKTALFKMYNPIFFNEEQTRALHTAAFNRAYRPDGFKRQLMATISAKPRGSSLKKLHLKSLIIHGEIDPVFPPQHAIHLAACIPNSRLEILEDMGHVIPVEYCKRIAQWISQDHS
ncbi:MAG: alpha/beta hydrolase [Legionella sp.]|nr:alpha/beta hydrolase [Legionella sp.]